MSAPTARRAGTNHRSPYDFAAWLVDLDGTLYRQPLVRAAMAAELALFGWPDIQILREFRHEHERLRELAIPNVSDPYFEQIHRTALALGVTEQAVTNTVERWMTNRPGRWIRLFRRRRLLRVIAAYRAAGGKTAIVSDYPARTKLSAINVTSLFDIVIACGEANAPCALKPHPDGFLRAAQGLEVAPNACLVIGDRFDADGEAAERAGMAFQHIKSFAVS